MSEVGVEQRANPRAESTRTTQERPGPWRITFDTNPDDCNLHCIMCEDHSPYSTTQSDRRKLLRPSGSSSSSRPPDAFEGRPTRLAK